MFNVFKHSLFRYLFVGVINTLIGFGIIFALMYLGVIPEIANFCGFIIAVFCSFILNKHFTFKSKNSHTRDLPRFLIAMGIAYLINLAVLGILYRFFGVDKYISQIFAGICYTISGYFLSRFYAFK